MQKEYQNLGNGYPQMLQVFSFQEQSIKLVIPEPDAVKALFRKRSAEGEIISFPYWSQVWPASLALCFFLDKHIEFIKHKKVIELGAGLGLPSLLAGCYTNDVCCTDYDPEAVSWARKSAIHNGLDHIRHFVADWNHLPAGLTTDTLLLSDANYEPAEFKKLQSILHDFLLANTTIILSTPQRLSAKSFIEPLLPWCKYTEHIKIKHQSGTVPVSIFVLSR